MGSGKVVDGLSEEHTSIHMTRGDAKVKTGWTGISLGEPNILTKCNLQEAIEKIRQNNHVKYVNTICSFRTKSRSHTKKKHNQCRKGVSKNNTQLSHHSFFFFSCTFHHSNALIWRSADTLTTLDIFFRTNGGQQVSEILLAMCTCSAAKASGRTPAGNSPTRGSVNQTILTTSFRNGRR